MKICSKCGKQKPLDKFYRRVSIASGYRAACKACEKQYRDEHPEPARAASRAWVARNPEKAKSSRDTYRFSQAGKAKLQARKLAAYGTTPEQRDAKFEAQGKRCACCGTTEPGKVGWHTEHDHDYNFLRGVTCGKCNMGIGLLGDSALGVQMALNYLRPALPEGVEGYA